jgi:hypothetical protein
LGLNFLVEALQWPSLQVVAAAVENVGRSNTVVPLASRIASVLTVIEMWIVRR